MKKLNKILSIILAILMVISIIPITASAVPEPISGTHGDNLIWTYNPETSTLNISGIGSMKDDLSTEYPWSSYAANIENVVIESGVTTIASNAFETDVFAPYNIKNVEIADTVTKISSQAFDNCDNLTSIIIPVSVTTIYPTAFNDCDGLKDVYYTGTEQQWNKLTISVVAHAVFNNATIHFLGEEVHECSYNAVVTAPTCTEKGYTKYTCDCGKYYFDDYVNATGHNYNAVITPPTCTEKGYTTHICTVCGKKQRSDFVDANGHDINISKSILKEATCTEGGYRYVQCSNCDFIFYFAQTNAKGHWYEEQTLILPTCTEQGYIYSVCECGDYFEEYVDALGHKEEKLPAVAPTCTETGLTAGTKCSVCGEITKEQDVVPAKGHKYKSKITTPASHTATGVMTFTCYCGDTYTEIIEKSGEHNYESAVTAPTCTERGYTTYTCNCGDTYVADYVEALGHTEEILLAVAPTCTETGLTEGLKCSVCDEIFTEQTTVDALGHIPANAVDENYIAPTCTENGSKDVVIYCSACEEEISRETVEIDATGHADNDGDGYCDADNELLDPTVECECNCHKSGISKIFFNFILFFQRIFGSNKVCDCGVAHY